MPNVKKLKEYKQGNVKPRIEGEKSIKQEKLIKHFQQEQ